MILFELFVVPVVLVTMWMVVELHWKVDELRKLIKPPESEESRR